MITPTSLSYIISAIPPLQHHVDNAATAVTAEGVVIDIQLEAKTPSAPVGTATRIHSNNTETETQKGMEQDPIGGDV
jgi:hypothetical protein